ncbi:(2Fe-2S)-binding protein [Ammoniphilus sp. 3BR4]|uniref:(2Fe-2S)-binding protein n=1 Tax=Ammoniphilus sp. 3BR4 TaxID=3158265 RepID=UPI003465DB78
MKSMRIIDHPVLGKLEEKKEVKFTFDGKTFSAYEGETIAAALLAHGVRTLRSHEEKKTPRGIYCNIGHCFECRVKVDGKSVVRSCLTPVTNGMSVESGMLNVSSSTKGVKP